MAGLSAAEELVRAGTEVLVLEARAEVGGRARTMTDPRLGLPLELGAEFVHGRPAPLWSRLKQARLKVREAADAHFCSQRGKVRPCDAAWEGVVETIAEAGPLSGSFAEYARHVWREGGWDEHQRMHALQYVEGFYAAHPEVASAHAIAQMEQRQSQAGGGRLYRVQRGYVALAHAMAAPLAAMGALRLGTSVQELRWKRGKVQVSGHGVAGYPLERLEAEAAIVTLPTTLIADSSRPHGLAFSPRLPEKIAAARKLPLGAIVKIHLRFRERFWSENALFHMPADAEVPVFWPPFADAPVLTGWAGGPKGEALSGRTDGELADVAVRTLSAAFGLSVLELAHRLEAVVVADWERDPYALGGYAVIPAQAGIAAQQALAAPVEDTIFFAGEATDFEGAAGTVQGAMETGLRAAREVLAALGGHNKR